MIFGPSFSQASRSKRSTSVIALPHLESGSMIREMLGIVNPLGNPGNCLPSECWSGEFTKKIEELCTDEYIGACRARVPDPPEKQAESLLYNGARGGTVNS